MNIPKLISTWIKEQRESGVEIVTKEVGLLFDFGYWLEKAAAEQSFAADGARRCPACKALLEERSVYCDNCGTDMPRS